MQTRGPHSPLLTKEIQAHNKELSDLGSAAELGASEKDIIAQFKGIMELKPAILEVAATYVYCSRDLGKGPAEATCSARLLKGFYTIAQVSRAPGESIRGSN